MPRAVELVAVAAGALSLAGCGIHARDIPGIGGDDSGTRDGKAAKAAVQRFALAAGPEACDMFTPAGLRKVYGKGEPPGPPPNLNAPPPPISLAECRRRSVRFSGQNVKIDRVTVLSGKHAAKVEASTDDARHFIATVRQKGNAWLIEDITEK
jgi:hypothetical protein